MPSVSICPRRHHFQKTRPIDVDADIFPTDSIIRLLRAGQSSFALDSIALSMIHQDVRRSENCVSTFDLQFGRLQKERSSIYRNLQAYQSLFVPIHRLPLDVLLHIFHFLPVDTINPNSTPWILGSICSSWRSIYLSFPTLWSRVAIDTSNGKRLCSQSVSMVRTSLKRSQRSPLTILVSCDNQVSSISPSLLSILDLLFAHSSRWSLVEVHIPRLSYQIFDRLGPLPMLRKIRVTLDRGPVPVGTRDLLGRSPQLHDVSLRGIPLSSLNLPLSRLALLEGTIQTTEDLFAILAGAKVLEALTISHASSLRILSSSHRSKTLTFPSIRRLHFRCGPVQEIADRLLLPNLEHLTIGCHSNAQPFSSSDMQSVKTLVQRSRCLLRSLSLNFTVCLHSIGAICSNLTRLSVVVESWAACETFIALRVRKDDDNLVSKLVELRFTDVTSKCGGQSFTHEPFMPMIESRWNVPQSARVAQLRRVEIHAKYGWGDLYYSDMVHRTLRRYVDEGLDVMIFDEASTAQSCIL
ncbi:uncharacterized protein EV420DRAFT_208036 [Desarmillaria tabescens]|uniref:F-box domain-containing protein n=1 Tax=Armillaria tabescens TaxID=1929756 RepID=A0AA39N7F4_ARMTA|nr:uncharacterized protein EV420DRAFT_208036 [Desarmillaria tabescens]KAK0460385.1 hypothetical protein EV420DRAFT_208036 [Desarmillaria tabescens]